MNRVWIYSLTSVSVISLVSLAGIATLFLTHKRQSSIMDFLVAFAVGGLFGDVFFHLIPESFERLASPLLIGLLVIGGFIAFFVLEKFLRWRHINLPLFEHAKPIVALNLVGDAVHNALDGVLVAISFMADVSLGLATTIAIILHEIPQELGDFAILVNGGLSPKKALGFNLLSALTAVIGAAAILAVGVRVEGVALIMLPVTAGGFLYIAGPDLIPELHHEVRLMRSLRQLVAILLGVGIMIGLALLEH